jgi:hypothetical protein
VEFGFFVHRGTAYIPTRAKTDAGFYGDIEPVEVAVTTDTAEFLAALRRAIARGNPIIPTVTRDRLSIPDVLRHAKVRSWRTFERDSTCWEISEQAGNWGFGRLKRRPDRGWEEDPSQFIVLPPNTGLDDVLAKLVMEVQRLNGV